MSEYTQRKIIGWTFALVLLLGAIEIKMFLTPPSTLIKAIAMAHHVRMPAGMYKTQQENNALLDVADEILDFKVPCKRRTAPIDAGSSRQIRVHYEICSKDDYKIVSLLNETNSYQGTVFNLDDKSQTSDFIPLKEGPNHFKIILMNSEHQKSEQEYIFTRAIVKTQAH